MLESIKKRQASATMMKHFLLVALLYPLEGSKIGSMFAPDVVYANVFTVAFVVLAFLEGNLDWKRKNILLWTSAFCLVGFNAFALYANVAFYGWYGGQLNVTAAFLFFFAWLMMKDSAPCMKEDVIRFVLKTAAITTVISLIPGLFGYSGVEVRVDGIRFVPYQEDFFHFGVFEFKGVYAIVMILFIALSLTYRRFYEKKSHFWGSIAIFTTGLVLSNTRAAILPALLILVGVVMDYLAKKAGGFRWKHLLWLIPFGVAGVLLLYKFSQERNLLTLGHRTFIWKSAVLHILDNPWGLGAMAGAQPWVAEGYYREVWNCHNVFLNLMLQFSIPAGFFCSAIFGLIIIASIWKNRSFTTLGIWVAILVPLNMDWSMRIGHMPLVLMMLYFLFFHPLRNAE